MRDEQGIYLAMSQSYRRRRRTRGVLATIVCLVGGAVVWFGIVIPTAMRWMR